MPRHPYPLACGPRINTSELLLHRLSSPSRCVSLHPAHIASVSDVKFLGERHIVSADVIGRLSLWDYHTPLNPVVAQWSAHSDCINSIAGGSEGKFVTAGNDRVLRVWDVCQLQGGAQGSEKALQELHGHASYVLSCDLSPTSLLISSVSLDSTLRLWHPTSPHPIFCATLPVAASCVRFVEGECTLLLTSGPDGVFMWDIRRHPSYQLLVAPPPPTPYRDPVWDATPTSRRTRPTPSTPITPTLLSPSPGPFTPSSYTTPAKTPSTQNPAATPNEPSYPFWRVDWSSSPAPPPRARPEESNKKFTPVAQLQSKNTSINQKKFDKSSQRYVQLFSSHSAPVYSVVSSHVGRHAVTASGDHKLKLWDLPTQQGLFTYAGCSLTGTGTGPVPCLTADDKTLICGSSNGNIYFWNTFSGADETSDNSVRSVHTHDHPITCLALSSDDATIVSGDDSGTIQLRTANDCILSHVYKDPD